MYKLTAFPAVAQNFIAYFGPDISISPYFDRTGSNESGMLKFIAHKFVTYLIKCKGYDGTAHEPLELFLRRKYSDSAWKFLKKLM